MREDVTATISRGQSWAYALVLCGIEEVIVVVMNRSITHNLSELS